MIKKIIAVVSALTIATAAYAADIVGAGASFPYPIYSKWADEYAKKTGDKLNYQSVGSGAGIKQIQAKTVTFGATDSPLKPEALAKDNLVQFPTVIGGNVMIVNLDGLKSREMVLDGVVIADIYLGKIKNWNDPAIKKLNPSLNLPDLPITVIRRSDGSGTTFIFTNYLSKASEAWDNTVGEGTAVEFPVGVGAKGNDGVANNVKQTKGAIGYVEYAYAKQNGLAYTNLINKAGKVVSPGVESFQAASKAFDPSKGFYAILTDSDNPDAWPITGATFIVMQKNSIDPAAAKKALDFFSWAYDNGDTMAKELDYAPLSPETKKAIREYWKTIN